MLNFTKVNYRVREIVFESEAMKITWKNGEISKLLFPFLRIHCPCASCVDELTGERILDEKKIPLNIIPVESFYVGNYAIQIKWSDNHDTGIYSFKSLYQLCKQV